MIKNIVHSTMLDLMGVKKARGVDGSQKFVLPDPLCNGDIARIAPDGTKQWNPNWQEDGWSTWNRPYLESTVKQVISSSKENVSFSYNSWGTSLTLYSQTTPDTDEIIRAAQQYYTTLRSRYSAQTTASGKARGLRKNTKGTRRQRRRAVSNADSAYKMLFSP
jgi:hypothetical protein